MGIRQRMRSGSPVCNPHVQGLDVTVHQTYAAIGTARIMTIPNYLLVRKLFFGENCQQWHGDFL